MSRKNRQYPISRKKSRNPVPVNFIFNNPISFIKSKIHYPESNVRDKRTSCENQKKYPNDQPVLIKIQRPKKTEVVPIPVC
jgi:hypothetical protein